ncbi:MAG: hypothetical protein QOI21_2841 [Actinomycetota bacterium]|jgi:hypothetical protein|nr:hypothetical protein [Actinomycetota bacterium]
MEHDEVTAKGGGPGLSTQDLLDAEPGGEHRLTDVPPEEEVRDESAADARDEGRDETTDRRDATADEGRGAMADEGRGDADESTPLFADQEVDRFRQDWQGIQIAFVDDPKRAVSEADELVAAVIQSLAATFASHKSELESQWQQGEAATEDLRVALRQYRSFFNQLLSS